MNELKPHYSKQHFPSATQHVAAGDVFSVLCDHKLNPVRITEVGGKVKAKGEGGKADCRHGNDQ